MLCQIRTPCEHQRAMPSASLVVLSSVTGHTHARARRLVCAMAVLCARTGSVVHTPQYCLLSATSCHARPPSCCLSKHARALCGGWACCVINSEVDDPAPIVKCHVASGARPPPARRPPAHWRTSCVRVSVADILPFPEGRGCAHIREVLRPEKRGVPMRRHLLRSADASRNHPDGSSSPIWVCQLRWQSGNHPDGSSSPIWGVPIAVAVRHTTIS